MEARLVAAVRLRRQPLLVRVRRLLRLVGTDQVVLPAPDLPEHGLRPRLAGSWQVQVAEHLPHQADLVVLVVDREPWVDADRASVAPEDACAERVECAHRDVAPVLADQPEDALAHLRGGLVREGHREDVPRLHAPDADQVRDAVGQDARLARSGTGQDQERAVARGDGTSLLGVEPGDDLRLELGSPRVRARRRGGVLVAAGGRIGRPRRVRRPGRILECGRPSGSGREPRRRLVGGTRRRLVGPGDVHRPILPAVPGGPRAGRTAGPGIAKARTSRPGPPSSGRLPAIRRTSSPCRGRGHRRRPVPSSRAGR